MKKIAIILAIVLLLLSGCSQKTAESNMENNEVGEESIVMDGSKPIGFSIPLPTDNIRKMDEAHYGMSNTHYEFATTKEYKMSTGLLRYDRFYIKVYRNADKQYNYTESDLEEVEGDYLEWYGSHKDVLTIEKTRLLKNQYGNFGIAICYRDYDIENGIAKNEYAFIGDLGDDMTIEYKYCREQISPNGFVGMQVPIGTEDIEMFDSIFTDIALITEDSEVEDETRICLVGKDLDTCGGSMIPPTEPTGLSMLYISGNNF